jgi:capsule polysaccharide export protein KpsE/RkpR
MQNLKLNNFKAKEGRRLNLSLVQQSLMLSKKLNHLEIRKKSAHIEREVRSQKSREVSAKKDRSTNIKMYENF